MIPHHPTPFRKIRQHYARTIQGNPPHHSAVSSTVSFHPAPYFTILHHATSSCTNMHYPAPSRTISHSALLRTFSTIQHHTAPIGTILHHSICPVPLRATLHHSTASWNHPQHFCTIELKKPNHGLSRNWFGCWRSGRWMSGSWLSGSWRSVGCILWRDPKKKSDNPHPSAYQQQSHLSDRSIGRSTTELSYHSQTHKGLCPETHETHLSILSSNHTETRGNAWSPQFTHLHTNPTNHQRGFKTNQWPTCSHTHPSNHSPSFTPIPPTNRNINPSTHLPAIQIHYMPKYRTLSDFWPLGLVSLRSCYPSK